MREQVNKTIAVVLALWLTLSGVIIITLPLVQRAEAQGTITTTVDPCATNAPKNSTFANITTATTTSLVAISGTTSIYVCGFVATMTGTTTADTFLLEYGTGGTCGTGTTVLTPTFNSGVLTQGATVIAYNDNGSVLKPVPAGNGLCAVSTVATSPTINLQITYIQQ